MDRANSVIDISVPVEASVLPSGEYVTHLTAPWCPSSTIDCEKDHAKNNHVHKQNFCVQQTSIFCIDSLDKTWFTFETVTTRIIDSSPATALFKHNGIVCRYSKATTLALENAQLFLSILRVHFRACNRHVSFSGYVLPRQTYRYTPLGENSTDLIGRVNRVTLLTNSPLTTEYSLTCFPNLFVISFLQG